MGFTFYFAAFLLICVTGKQIYYIKDLKIPTRKTTGELVVICAGILSIIIITLCFAPTKTHHLLATAAVVLLFLIWIKQGIGEKGILIVGRGKAQFLWQDLAQANIVVSNKIKVEYYAVSNFRIACHFYDLNRLQEIKNNYQTHGLLYHIEVTEKS